jgi:hypothetical protein
VKRGSRAFAVVSLASALILTTQVVAQADGIIDSHNWDDGPETFGLFFNSTLVANLSNYFHVRITGHDSWVYDAYSAWAWGDPTEEKIAAHLWNNTTGSVVTGTSNSIRTYSYTRGVLTSPSGWLLSPPLIVGDKYHWHFTFYARTAENTGWVSASGENSAPFTCYSSECHF